MRWMSKNKPKPKEGDTRIKKRWLLIFPKRINEEYRWLEPVTWEEECIVGNCHGPEVPPRSYLCLQWKPIRWIEE